MNMPAPVSARFTGPNERAASARTIRIFRLRALRAAINVLLDDLTGELPSDQRLQHQQDAATFARAARQVATHLDPNGTAPPGGST